MRRHFYLFAFLFFPLSLGLSLPKYTIKEKKRCDYCHISKKGGGPLSHRGRYYEKYKSFKGYQSPSEVKKKQIQPLQKKQPVIRTARKDKKNYPQTSLKPPQTIKVVKKGEKKRVVVAVKEQKKTTTQTALEGIQEKVNFFGNARAWYMPTQGGPNPHTFFLMQVEPGLSVEFLKELNLVLSYNIPTPLITAYLQYEFTPDHYIQVGSFNVPMGLGYDDHTTFLLDQLHIGTDTRDIGVMFGSTTDFFYKVAFTFGERQPKKHLKDGSTITKSDAIYTLNLGYQGKLFGLSALSGGSFMYEQGSISSAQPKRDTSIFDLYLTLIWNKLSFLGEAALALDKPTHGKDSLSTYLGLTYDFIPQVSALVRYDWYAEDANFLKDFTHRFTLGGRWRIFDHFALEPYFRFEKSFKAGTNIQPSNSIFILGHLFF
ncbi:MAG: hypothetical protein HYW47_02620 [Deltaproteobacteria bacterium]|nr:hypothetical protein [Deltaproteobacteria bacterium]